jgi:hypothetical protein
MKIILKSERSLYLFILLLILSSCTPMVSQTIYISISDQNQKHSIENFDKDKALVLADKLFSEYGFEEQQNYPEFVNGGGVKWYRINSLISNNDRTDVYIYSNPESNKLVFEVTDSLSTESSKLSVELSDKLTELFSGIIGVDNIDVKTNQ